MLARSKVREPVAGAMGSAASSARGRLGDMALARRFIVDQNQGAAKTSVGFAVLPELGSIKNGKNAVPRASSPS